MRQVTCYLVPLCTAIMVTATTAQLAAQTVRGVAVALDDVTPAAGVVVTAETSAGARAGSALTDERGRFLLRLPNPGNYTLRTLRIGYAPTVVRDLMVEATGERFVRLRLTGVALPLPAVIARSDEICRGRRGDGELVAQLWEEARKALIASQLSSGDAPLIANWVEYDRVLPPTGTTIRRQRVRATRSPTTRAFRSVPAAQLAERGYVVTDAGEVIYHAPDAEVLLDDAFASTHCFRVQPDTGRASDGISTRVGIGFRPARTRDGVRDIEGVLWIDRATSRLQSLEYRYTNMPRAAELAGAGGTVEFLGLNSGQWLVSRWQIRMPQLGEPERIREGGAIRIVKPSSDAAVVAVQMTGGEVHRVERGDSVVYVAPTATVRIQVGSLALPVQRGTRVLLSGTNYETLVDSAGIATLPAVLAGRYTAEAYSPFMDSLDIPPARREIDASIGRTAIDTLRLPYIDEMLRTVCAASAPARRERNVRGVVFDSAGRPVPGAGVVARWLGGVGASTGQLTWNEGNASTRTDSTGSWSLCVANTSILTLRAMHEGWAGDRTLRLVPDERFTYASLTLDRDTRLVPLPDMALRYGGQGRVTIVVSDSSGRGIAGVLVELVANGNSRARSARTDGDGRAHIGAVDPGRQRLSVRRVGFAASDFEVEVRAGESSFAINLDRAGAATLDTLHARADRVVLARHSEMELRRLRKEASMHISREEIDKRNPVDAWQLVTRAPSLMVLDSLGLVIARTRRISTIPCWARLAIDGLLVPTSNGRSDAYTDLRRMPPPAEIHAIEIFAGSARVPPQFGMTGCGGIIAVWTR